MAEEQIEQSFDQGVDVVKLTLSALIVYRRRVPWSAITGIGVAHMDPSVRVGNVRVKQAYAQPSSLLLVVFQIPGERQRELTIPLSSLDDPLVQAVAARRPETFKGVDGTFAIRKKLGLRSAKVVALTVALMAATAVVLGVIAWLVKR